MAKRLLAQRRIFLVEDDRAYAKRLARSLTWHGAEVTCAYSSEEALRLFGQEKQPFDLALVDLDLSEAATGIDVANHLRIMMRTVFPRRPFITVAMSNYVAEFSAEHLGRFFEEVVEKRDIELRDPHWMPRWLADILRKRVRKRRRKPNVFMVHGHDDSAKLALKNYLQNTLDLGEPVILHERPSQGRTIIEKFEQETRAIDLVFVILTPDDIACSVEASEADKRRARQNVIFELGYFYAKLQRSAGKVILLKKGEIELPSDTSGIVYLDISNGIEAAGELIRRELQEWL